MKAYRSLTVRPQTPQRLAPLERLIRNLRWTWHAPTREFFESIDPQLWQQVGGDPLKLTAAVPAHRMEQLAEDAAFCDRMAELNADLDGYLTAPTWFDDHHAAEQGPAGIAYFSMEFGISDVLPNFSGGLGVLAGDHLKSASDLGVPLIGVGLFYRFGYFAQTLSPDGWQEENYAAHDPHSLAMEPVLDADGRPIIISVDMPGGIPLHARIWQVRVGRVPLLLLDADIEANDDAARASTDRLYGGDQAHRIRQEILLGVGGMRAVRAFCAAQGRELPDVFHMNEGHAGFLGLERISALMTESHRSFDEALAEVRASTIFTTHTPVPAGIDRFPVGLVRHYLDADDGGFCRVVPGVPVAEVLDLGAEADPDRFNMAHLGLRIAQRANGVAKLHGAVSRAMFADLYPGFDIPEVPIGSVTNGVHLDTWQDAAIRPVAETLAGSSDLTATDTWAHRAEQEPGDLWGRRRALRMKLVDLARRSVRQSYLHRGRSAAELGWTDTMLDPDILTIGFARRVSTYKRLTLMLADPGRFKAILTNPDRPVQIIIAGKAHPADDGGKHLMQQMVQFADDPQIRHRVAFLPNYSMSMAAVLCAGADVWLNNPIRPQEASGTSGMKAALNGALNVSISDGWWDELYDGQDGWEIPSADVDDDGRRDELEATALYEVLENRVIPLFYDRDDDGLPGGWIDRINHTLSYLGPRVQATRMVRDYVQEYYTPAARTARLLTGQEGGSASFVDWQQMVRRAWPAIRVLGVDVSGIDTEPALGHTMTLRTHVNLGGLTPEDVEVQAILGTRHEDGTLADLEIHEMSFVGNGGAHRFQAEVPLRRAGSLGYTVRVLPRHPLLASRAEMGLVTTP